MAIGRSFVSILRKLSSFKVPVNPSSFPFSQEVALEILEYLIPELSLAFPFFGRLFNTRVKICTTCNACNNISTSYQVSPFLQLPLTSSVQSSVDNFLESEELSGVNSYFCHYCNNYQTATVEKEVAECSSNLILQLKRFAYNKGLVSKVCSPVTSYPGTVSIPITVESEVSCCKHYKLRAVINHSGNLNNSHYTNVAYNQVHGKWFHFNDRAVVPCKQRLLNGAQTYILFLEELSAATGVKAITDRLDKIYLKDENQTAYLAYETFEKYKRPSEMSMNDYLIEFERLYHKIQVHRMEVPDGVLADKQSEEYPGGTRFKFGDSEAVCSIKRVILPVIIGSKEVNLETEVVPNEIPLLLSQTSLRKADAVLDFKRRIVLVDAFSLEEIELDEKNYDHLLPQVAFVCASEKSNKNKIVKLHRQFCHPSAEKLKSLI
ncbi:ubiquitin carboxyl-terminal hydrolase 20-like [Hydractinia symbiolongicarpus]|uniref:ubiquitin carboxyl-terminal hydrolase 20-like n=1 Tax=Hydractinia symbiolongicarpus TaxID=13093 RepID=UPI00255061E0|nr:ubiquitin carboxyl-terminal hydrolase 20-like [Hydractinia symbiolongicarpus]